MHLQAANLIRPLSILFQSLWLCAGFAFLPTGTHAFSECLVQWQVDDPGERLVNFPLLVRVGSEVSGFFPEVKPDGSNLVMLGPSGKPLPLEVESWDSVKNQGCLWVLVDTVLPQAVDMFFHLRTSSQAVISPKSVFSPQDGWSGVYHMEGRGFESTEQAPAAQDSGTTAVPGAIGGARGFSNANAYATSGAYLNLGAPASLNISGQITMEAWVRWNSKANHRIIVCHGQGNGNSTETVLRVGEFQDYRTGVWTGKAAQHAHANASAADSGKWIHLAGTYDGAKWSLYRNGVKVADTAVAGGAQSSPGSWRVGAEWTGSAVSRYFHGDIDEVRISKVARSSGYFKLSYASQTPGQLGRVKVTQAPVSLFPILPRRKATTSRRGREDIRIFGGEKRNPVAERIWILPDGRKRIEP